MYKKNKLYPTPASKNKHFPHLGHRKYYKCFYIINHNLQDRFLLSEAFHVTFTLYFINVHIRKE